MLEGHSGSPIFNNEGKVIGLLNSGFKSTLGQSSIDLFRDELGLEEGEEVDIDDLPKMSYGIKISDIIEKYSLETLIDQME